MSFSSSPVLSSAMSPPSQNSPPFLFPEAKSTLLPDPSRFFAPHLLSAPLPTNAFFENYVLKNGDQPEYIHPYLIKSYKSALTLSYPTLYDSPSFLYEIFIGDFTITTLNNPNPDTPHVVTSFSDLSVTLEYPSNNLRFFLVRGSPFLTCEVRTPAPLSFSSLHGILELIPNSSHTKHTVKLNNNQTWLIYTSSPINLSNTLCGMTSDDVFSGIIRVVVLPAANPKFETLLDKFSSCYAIYGDADITSPDVVEYKWDKKGSGDLLLLAHPLHLQLLSKSDSSVSLIEDFKYDSIDGELVGVVGDSWVLKNDPVPVTWHSVKGVSKESCSEIIDALVKDVATLDSSTISTKASYFYSKLIGRAARLALVAEEVGKTDVIPAIMKFLKETIEPWLEGTFDGNGFLYDPKWGGILTKHGAVDVDADYGFGVYHDHHYHYGYFLSGVAVLAKFDAEWGKKYKPHTYAIISDFMTSTRKDSHYTRWRYFDLWKMHSWACGLAEWAVGKDSESTSEAVNAYYSAGLIGMAYGDSHLASLASTLTGFEIQGSKTWWHIKEEGSLYPPQFTKHNRLVGILWPMKRDTCVWFAPPEHREGRLGIHLIPITPISEALFSDIDFVKQLVKWTLPSLEREGVADGWKGFVYALQAVYDKKGALGQVRKLNGHDDGNSLANLLWWIHSRG